MQIKIKFNVLNNLFIKEVKINLASEIISFFTVFKINIFLKYMLRSQYKQLYRLVVELCRTYRQAQLFKNNKQYSFHSIQYLYSMSLELINYSLDQKVFLTTFYVQRFKICAINIIKYIQQSQINLLFVYIFGRLFNVNSIQSRLLIQRKQQIFKILQSIIVCALKFQQAPSYIQQSQ
ncbi:hypothetical protein TTHERM_000052579 (macronuclear) [Tetrahymena thermophila SB210]|uniref:Uncharacterized protein n=1 Tax=Tetrahymena thermophila (strain SB210) TaxID=312017 RepID=W7XIH2_TETTS|nr:hypothetical protein TTHERM_000052579 [Tetrahymena thermophila SB210]EWS74646.1 hypothetical protein TTHERM_000052579 [Tetrahymena thermophila SB210]|eukprot:XP_012652868.1 hypothetical protein TTHERM_000052579 [Tetrahymena thermophila SB210]